MRQKNRQEQKIESCLFKKEIYEKKEKQNLKSDYKKHLLNYYLKKILRTLLFLIYVKKQASIEEHFTYTIKIKMI